MARKMKIDSVIGSYLDPLADKVKNKASPSKLIVIIYSRLQNCYWLIGPTYGLYLAWWSVFNMWCRFLLVVLLLQWYIRIFCIVSCFWLLLEFVFIYGFFSLI